MLKSLETLSKITTDHTLSLGSISIFKNSPTSESQGNQLNQLNPNQSRVSFYAPEDSKGRSLLLN